MLRQLLTRSIIAGFPLALLAVAAEPQTAPVTHVGLTLKNGVASASRYFSPKRHGEAHEYRISLRSGRITTINIASKSVFLSNDNECGLYFSLTDPSGKQVFLGDSPTGIDAWEGKLAAIGTYRIKMRMSCLEAFTTDDILRAKPKFHYTLKVATRAPDEGDRQ